MADSRVQSETILKTDLPEGYEDTEIGSLPEEWEVLALERVVDFTRKPRGLRISDLSEVPFIPMESIPANGIDSCDFVLKSGPSISSGTYCESGDVLIAKITPSLENGKQGIVPKELPHSLAVATTEVYPLKSKPDLLDRDFLFFYLLYGPVRQNLASKMEGSTGRQRLPKHVLNSLLIPLPHLPEQQAIAHVLSTVQKAIESTEKVIEASKELKRSLMNHLFTYGPIPVDEAEQVPLKETEIGSVPEHWSVDVLGQMVTKKVTDGTHKTPQYTATGVPFITAKDIRNGRIDFSESKFVSPEEHRKLASRCNPEMGDILLSKVGTLGLVAEVDVELDFSIFVQLALIKPDVSKILPDYLRFALLSPNVQSEIVRTSSQSTMRYIGVGKIASLAIPVPPPSEQQEIVHALKSVEEKIRVEENRKRSLDSLFKSLLHNLMTCKVRVNDLDMSAVEAMV